MNLENKIRKLEKELQGLKKDLKKQKKVKLDESDFQTNVISDYMIKLVYPRVYEKFLKGETIEIGFPKNRGKLLTETKAGQNVFLYVASPVKKIIGLGVITNGFIETGTERWPNGIEIKMKIGPKRGLTFNDVNLPIRPRPGDTIFSISKSKAYEIIAALNSQEDLSVDNVRFLADEYKDGE